MLLMPLLIFVDFVICFVTSSSSLVGAWGSRSRHRPVHPVMPPRRTHLQRLGATGRSDSLQAGRAARPAAVQHDRLTVADECTSQAPGTKRGVLHGRPPPRTRRERSR